jgi:hypothetical protein
MSGGVLKGVNAPDGTAVFSSKDNCSGVREWTSPIAVNGRVIAGGDGHLCAWSAP